MAFHASWNLARRIALPHQQLAVRSRREIPEIGVTVLTLSNGVDVWFKPTDFRNDQIVFRGYAPGGTSLAGCDNFFNNSNRALDQNSDAAAHVLMTLAQNPIPDRPATPPAASALRSVARAQATDVPDPQGVDGTTR